MPALAAAILLALAGGVTIMQIGAPRANSATPAAAVAEALRHPETVQRLGQIGLTVVADSPDSYGAFQRAEIERWRGVVRAAGIKPE